MPARIDASADSLSRSASLPASTAFTMLARAKISTLRSADSTILALESAGGSAGEYVYISAANVLSIYCSNSGQTTFASTPSTGVEFDVSLRRNGSAVGGAWKLSGASTWISATGTGTTWTPATLTLGSDSTSAWFNGTISQVKIWDRVLSDDELMVESFYRRVMYPTSINGNWPIDLHTDLADRSGNGRDLTAAGTLTTEDTLWQAWKPGASVLRRATAAATGAKKLISGKLTRGGLLLGGSIIR